METKYSIELTGNGVLETLEINGDCFFREWISMCGSLVGSGLSLYKQITEKADKYLIEDVKDVFSEDKVRDIYEVLRGLERYDTAPERHAKLRNGVRRELTKDFFGEAGIKTQTSEEMVPLGTKIRSKLLSGEHVITKITDQHNKHGHGRYVYRIDNGREALYRSEFEVISSGCEEQK